MDLRCVARVPASFLILIQLLAVAVPAQPGAAQGEAAAVAAVLDSFHDAAAKADEARYFGHFAPEGVFLGTDATERWTVDEFRKWAAPYFRRPSAWTFVAASRNVVLAPEKTVAWFDEVVESRSYGSCRGTGALRKIDGVWRVTHYNLTVPVPNDLMDGVVRMIRKGTAATTVYLVRHAEKTPEDGKHDPALTEAGRARAEVLARTLGSAGIAAIWASDRKRTQETAAPLAVSLKLAVTVRPAETEAGALAREILEAHAGRAVLVCGHSNTVPDLIAAFGVKNPPAIADSEYDNLFVVTVSATGHASLVHLRIG